MNPYPVVVEFDRDLAVDRWRPFVNWLLAIPHWIVLYGLNIVSRGIVLVSFFTVLFTKDIPDGLFNFQTMVNRYSFRVSTFVGFMKNEYPPFEFQMDQADPGGDAARYSITKPAEYNRWLPLVKWLLLIPHYIVLVFLLLGAVVVEIIAMFTVLFTGQFPQGFRDYVIGVSRWANRVSAYFMLLVDEYPPFSLE